MNLEPSNLFHQVADEFSRQVREGESPDIEEFAAKHPELANRIRNLFPLMQMMEQRGDSDTRDDSDSGFEQEVNQVNGLPPQRELGEYQIVKELGRGGMGIVYQAWQESLGRFVALKILPTSGLLDQRRYQRFQQEARASGMLLHPNIVPVFGIGRSDDVSYFVMQYIDGQSLDHVITDLNLVNQPISKLDSPESLADTDAKSKALTSRSIESLIFEKCDQESNASASSSSDSRNAANRSHSSSSSLINSDTNSSGVPVRNRFFRNVAMIGLQVSEALQFAHSKKILHRDIKPANLMIDHKNHVWVTDFGLAKLMDEANLTRTGETLGTLRYLPPEQFDGYSDARSDVYSLGLTLYELMTLKPAFDGKDFAQLLQNVTESTPVLPRKIDSRIPRDLETIVMKSIARHPDKRYQSAAELHEDLSLFLQGKPINAKQTSDFERFVKAIKRHPIISTLSGLLLTCLIVGTFLVTWKWQQASAALELAKAESRNYRQINDFLLYDFLEFAKPENQLDTEVSLKTLLDRAAKQIDKRFPESPLAEARIRQKFGEVYLALSRTRDARVHLERSYQLFIRETGKSDEAIQSYLDLAHTEQLDGNHQIALQMFDEVLKFQKERFGQRSLEVASTNASMAQSNSTLGNVDAATQQLKSALEIAERQTDDPIETQGIQLLVASHLFDLGKLDESRQYLVELEELNTSSWEAKDDELILDTQNMEQFYLHLKIQKLSAQLSLAEGDFEEATRIAKENMELADFLLGESHITTLNYASFYCGVLVKSGQHENAMKLIESTIETTELYHSKMQPTSLETRNIYGMALLASGEIDLANSVFAALRTDIEKRYGEQSPLMLDFGYNQSVAFSRMGDYESAEEILGQVYQAAHSVYGESHTQTINALADLAHMHRKLGFKEQAEQEFLQAIQASREIYRDNHPDLLQTLENFVFLYLNDGQFEKAIPILEELATGHANENGCSNEKAMNFLYILAHVQAESGMTDQAITNLLSLLEIRKEVLGIEHTDTLTALVRTCQVMHSQESHQDVVQLVDEWANHFADSEDPPWHWVIAVSKQGKSLLELEQVELAQKRLTWTYEQLNQHLVDSAADSKTQEQLVTISNWLSKSYEESESKDNAEHWKDIYVNRYLDLERTKIESFVDKFGNGSPEVVAEIVKLADFLVRQKRKAEALPILIQAHQTIAQRDPLSDLRVSILFKICKLHHSLGEHDKVIERLTQYIDTYAPEAEVAWPKLVAINLLGRANLEAGNLAAAEKQLLAAFDGFETAEQPRSLERQSDEMRRAANRLMELYKRSNQQEEFLLWRGKYRKLAGSEDK